MPPDRSPYPPDPEANIYLRGDSYCSMSVSQPFFQVVLTIEGEDDILTVSLILRVLYYC